MQTRPNTLTSRPYERGLADISVALPPRDALQGISLLVVDDHAPTLRTLSFVLKTCGAEVFPASSSAEGLALFRAQRPNVIVADIGMPAEDGLSLLRRIRDLTDADGGRTLAIALTAYMRKEESERLLAGGFQAYLTKPVEPAELVNAIHAVVQQHV